MKRVFFIILCLVFILTSYAFAEDFSIHAGVQFGDTIDVVMQKESLELVDERHAEPEDNYNWKTILEYKGTVANIDRTTITYKFNDNDMLFDASYHFADSSIYGLEGVHNIYTTIHEALENKYGESLSNPDDVYYVIVGSAVTGALSNLNTIAQFGLRGEITYHDEWVVSVNDGYVKIDLVEYYTTDSIGKTSKTVVSYYPFTEEELNAAKQEAADKQSNMENDL